MIVVNHSPARGSTLILAWCGVGALVAGIISVLMLRHGIRLTPDGWTYWEGATSIFSGRGYYEFAGPRVCSWPPLYSLYLAGTELLLGVSGRQLAVANLALAVAAAFCWSVAILAPCGANLRQARAEGRFWVVYPLVVVLFIAITISGSYSYTAVLAHNLAYVFFPLVLYFTHRTLRAEGTARLFGFTATNVFVMSLLLATHNSFVFIPPLVGILLLLGRGRRMGMRVISAAISTAAPVAAWLAIRILLGQLHSHTPGLKPKYTWKEYAHQVFSGVGALCGPRQHHIGEVLLLVVCAIALVSLIMNRRTHDPVRGAMTCYLMLTGGFLVCLYVAFNTTFIYDELERDRFLLFVPLTVVPAALIAFWDWMQAGVAGADRRNAVRGRPIVQAIVVALFGIITALAAARTAKFFRLGGKNAQAVDVRLLTLDRGFAYNRLTLRADYAEGPPMEVGRFVLVAPAREPIHFSAEHSMKGTLK